MLNDPGSFKLSEFFYLCNFPHANGFICTLSKLNYSLPFLQCFHELLNYFTTKYNCDFILQIIKSCCKNLLKKTIILE